MSLILLPPEEEQIFAVGKQLAQSILQTLRNVLPQQATFTINTDQTAS